MRARGAAEAATLWCKFLHSEERRELKGNVNVPLPSITSLQQHHCPCLAAEFSALPAWLQFPTGAVFQSLLPRFLCFKDKRGSACSPYRPGTPSKNLEL